MYFATCLPPGARPAHPAPPENPTSARGASDAQRVTHVFQNRTSKKLV